LKCPKCLNEIENNADICPICGAAIHSRNYRVLRAVVAVISWLVVVAVLGVAAYKLYFWIDTYRFDKQYTRGAYAPTVAETILDDGRAGHSITYYGNDGDRIFFDELGKTIIFSGKVAQLEIPDSYWFAANVEETESADVSISSTLIYEDGDKRRLPAIEFSVAAPESPLELISPEQDDLSVNTSIYPLEVQVVPGSVVTVNGKDVTDIVDSSGLLSVNVNVFPVGDNTYTIIVKTPNHREARRDILIYRAEMEIAVELDSNTPTESSTNIVTISGKCDPGAVISVDTDYVENSITQNDSTGSFSFIAELNVIGDNVVRFRASSPGKADSVISLTINYLPTLDEYSRKAWAMDYESLSRMFEQWAGRIFLCEGEIVDVVYEGDVQYVIMDVGTAEEKQLLALENLSSVGTPSSGAVYSAYADVDGRFMYDGHYYPKLKARYMDIKTER
jgi:hypothetical protein